MLRAATRSCVSACVRRQQSIRTLRLSAPRLTAQQPTKSDRESAEDAPTHFRNTPGDHPLGIEKIHPPPFSRDRNVWANPMVNHVWSDEEIDQKLSTQPRHQPVLLKDKIAHGFLQGTYKIFNLVTGYDAANPSTDSVAFRLIFLESVAAVPGMVAAQHRHFRSLRNLKRDYGWIHTLIEEAENERMHLLTFLKVFTPGPFTRGVIYCTQFGFGALFIGLYLTTPPTAHRLVGYIEELAVHTYTNLIEMMETPGTQLHTHWRNLPAPDIAKAYWRLEDDADFFAVIRQVAADECNHRDVNHTFASMANTDVNPYVGKHLDDMAQAAQYWRQVDHSVEGSGLEYTMTPKVAPAANKGSK